jgi:hypothetical protein
MRILSALASAALAASCGGPNLGDGDFRCGELPDQCPPGLTCAADGFCRTGSPDDPDAGDSLDGPLGDNVGEECDDGNNLDGDGCDSNCTITACQNGIMTTGEACYTIGTPLLMGIDTSSVAIADVNDDLLNDIITTDRARDLLVYRPAVPGDFPGTVELPIGDQPVALGVRDFNGDKVPDVATANHMGTSATVFTGGAAGLSMMTTIFLSSGAFPVAAAFYDTNAGQRRLALLGETPVTYTYTYDGGTSFTPAPTIMAPAMPQALAVAQLDGIGGEDMVASSFADNTVTVYLQAGMDMFNATAYSTGLAPRAIAVGNFDTDTPVALDLAIACTGSDFVRLLINNGAGVFTPGGDLSVLAPVALAALDANLDGEIDLAVASSDGTVRLFLNQGGVNFLANPPYVVQPGVTGLAAGDLNNDGIPDLAVSTNGSDGYVTLILSDP